MHIDIAVIPAQEPYPVKGSVTVDVPEDFAMTATSVQVDFDGFVARSQEAFRLEGVMSANVPALCSLCLAETNYVVSLDIREIFTRDKTGVDDWPVAADKLDLLPVLRSNLLTALPYRILCKPDCKGLCPNCGSDLNKGPCNCKQ